MKFINLGDAATFVNGFAFKPSQWTESGLEIIRIQNLTGSSDTTNRFEGRLHDKYLVTKGDLLISWSATLGVFEWQRENGWLNQHIFKVVFDKFEWDKTYFKYLIEAKLQELSEQVHGATMKHITKKRFDKIQIPLPPLSEQRAIADRLDAADRLRQLDKALVEKYDELKRSLFLEMFGDPVMNEKGWEVAPLGDHINIIHGFPFKSEHFTYEPGPILLTPGNFIDEGGFKDRGDKQRFYDGEYPESYRLSPGDVLVAMTEQAAGLLGSTLIVPDDGIYLHNQRLGRLDSRTENFDLHFVADLFNCDTFRAIVAESSTGSKVKHTSPQKLMSVETIVPPVKLQRKYLTKIASFNRQQSLAREAAVRSEELFLGVLGEVFG